ncbi:MAG TPA: ABC transporter permease [Terriglobia bacterium]|nr:ABC transporter permease [Terriglobia bacterium]
MLPEWMTKIGLRIGALFRRGQLERDLDEELQFHLAMHQQKLEEQGMPPEEARYAARRAFGNPTQTKETSRDLWTFRFLETLAQDLRYGLRQLRRNPGFTVAAVLTLALGIGTNTAIFSLIDTILIKSLPVRKPEQLFLFRWESPHVVTDALPYPLFDQIRSNAHAFQAMYAFCNLDLATSVDGKPGLAAGQLVSGNFFSMLGVRTVAGRPFTPEEDRVPGGDPVAIISYRYWKRQFGLDPSAVGKFITLNGSLFTIIGITGPNFDGISVGASPDIWVPMMMQAQVMDGRALLNDPRGWFFRILGRLKNGVTTAEATADLNVAYHQTAMAEAGARITPQIRQELAGQRISLVPASRGLSALRDLVAKPLLILMGLVGLVLLIACANVASLLLTRASTRQKEIALRAALGAGRARLIRQLFTESVLLAILGSLAGLVLAHYGEEFLLALPFAGVTPLTLNLNPGRTMLVFYACTMLFTAILFGSAPALRASRVDLNEALKAGGRGVGGAGGRPSRSNLSNSIVVGEVALSLVLLAAAGMLVRSLLKLRNVNPGFNQKNVLIASIDPELIGYRGERLTNLYSQITDVIAPLPGIRSVSLSAVRPISRSQWRTGVYVRGHVVRPSENATVPWNLIAPDFFRTLEIPLLQGRDFTARDNAGAPKVAIINEAMARFYFGERSAIGRHLSLTGPGGEEIEIVGVVGNAKYGSMREPPQHIVYLPYPQAPGGGLSFGMTIELRTAGNPNSFVGPVRQAIRGVGRQIPILSFTTLAEEVNNSLAQERTVAELSCLFGLVALILAAVGLYGVMAYTVSRRASEIGIRMALGAQPQDVQGMVLRESLGLVIIGLAIGVPLTIAMAHLISSQLYGISQADPLTFIAVSLILVAVALLACYIPARRAAKVDPMIALRYE